MARAEAPFPQPVTVYDAVTGAPLHRWPVDAAELVRTGAATWQPPAAEPDPPAESAGKKRRREA